MTFLRVYFLCALSVLFVHTLAKGQNVVIGTNHWDGGALGYGPLRQDKIDFHPVVTASGILVDGNYTFDIYDGPTINVAVVNGTPTPATLVTGIWTTFLGRLR